MDPPRDTTTATGRSSSPNPLPPLALSDFLSQHPFSPYPYAYDGPEPSPDTTAAEADVRSTRPVDGDETQSKPDQEPLNETAAVTHLKEETAPPPQRPAATNLNWQSTRTQLPPSKNLGRKGDWIRGWSEAVGLHGDTAYCACSETLVARQSRKIKRGDFSVRAILQGTATPVQQASAAVELEPNVCHHCSRPSSPPVDEIVNSKKDKMDPPSGRPRGFKKVGKFLKRAISSQKGARQSQSQPQQQPTPQPDTPSSPGMNGGTEPDRISPANETQPVPVGSSPAAPEEDQSSDRQSDSRIGPRGDDWIKRTRRRNIAFQRRLKR
ncbi:hypothetical protein B0H66DRAFT_23037 [Apodospora peruviana]|uniref:Uncharacterized protein n=1 Tax=Apodospora peruviana TaxID=516989 RepID=A0AAE0IQC5_9PEZI|nr:hypothetical protein B0H66DRAFT_23037 [Apodospora peruviana]